MSFFVLFKTEPADTVLPGLSKLARSYSLEEEKKVTLDQFQLVFYKDHGHGNLLFFMDDNHDFVAVIGSLLFEGQSAPECLPKLLNKIDSGDFDWKGLLGTHVILFRKNGQLTLLSDGLGASKIYTNKEGALWSNSFLAMLEITEPRAFDIQACYEYVINGSVFGQRTLVDNIKSIPANTILSIRKDEVQTNRKSSPITNEALDSRATLDEVADYHCTRLSCAFSPIADCYGERIRLSFSGGFDSRLMLAMLIKHGARPTLFVYGNEDSEDVRIARVISKAEGLPLECIDKSKIQPPDPDAFSEETEKNLFAFDGWKVETPLFDFGEDRRDRLKRHVDGQVPLNGSLGEIYRNFFYIPDRKSSTEAVISTFYSRYDPRSFTDQFSEQGYRSEMARAMREAIGAESDELERFQVEELYPKFRGRFWTGRDAQINQRFGPMFFPYLEPAAISNTAKIPIRFKDLGYLQGRMISRVNPQLAGYPSDYGFPFDGPRPIKYRLTTFLGTQRPAALRKLSFRLKTKTRQPLDKSLTPPYLSKVIDLEFPIMRSLFDMDRVMSANQYGMIATLEYLGQRYNIQVPDR